MIHPMPTRYGANLQSLFLLRQKNLGSTPTISRETIMTTFTTAAPYEPSVTTHTHQTAPTQFVEANGIRFAYRRFGKAGEVPIVFNQHYTGTMDYWDPAVTDGLARDREVILFKNAGVPAAPARSRPRSSTWAPTRSPSAE